MKKPTIYEIKAALSQSEDENHFFDRATLRFFGQTMKSFRVTKTDRPGVYRLSAPIIDAQGRQMGETVRIYDADKKGFVRE